MTLILSIHIAFLLIWSSALLYFPRLLVQHVNTGEPETKRRTMKMQRAVYAYVMTPSALLAVVAGTWLIFERGFTGGWLPAKLTLVMLMVWLHAYLGYLMAEYRHGQRAAPLLYFKAFPVVLFVLISAIVTLVTWKPF